ncbi:hypothetical protein Pint_05764 [Pistacia integerrima]|uniref:Uncharacterized protein n=1 Tax=Pistacia integerrima TaxID=434235 RepID=A0ACC0Z0F6_9ROSI|nr:hypothetical protein Pint_05764 [Pistacia integerrima]
MVVKMMRWSPWPLVSRKFEVILVVCKLEGLNLVQFDEEKEKKRLVIEIKWKGQKIIPFGSLRKTVKRNFTEEGGVGGDGVVEWNEEFKSLISLSGSTDGFFLPLEVDFAVFNGPRNKVSIVGTGSLNIAEFVDSATEKELEIKVPLTIVKGDIIQGAPSLCLSLRLMESSIAQESSHAGQRTIVPLTSSPSSVEALSTQKDEVSAVKAGLRKVKIFRGCVSRQRSKKECPEEECSDGRCSVISEDVGDADSADGDAEEESDESKQNFSVQQSVNYETLASSNWAGGSCHANTISNPEDEGWIYYSNCRLDVEGLNIENSTKSVLEQSLRQSMKRRILPWRKRKLGFRSPKPKEEPLLKKDCREEGGDDIDFDRRQLSSSDESSFGWYKSEGSTRSRSSISEFGDDNFAVGSWENKEIISRDGHLKLHAQVFFASIDQRNERAAGESACTALVAVIANWLQSNRDEMPIKSEFDNLIREGSLEWRNLCENEDYIRQFPDKHFDLDTVLQAKIRPLSVVPEKSFVGFFHPEGPEGKDFDFLQGAMSFDSIWEEIIRYGSNSPGNVDPSIYIVSWNDHFFVLKVDHDAYYIIDTLGERLYEGCNQAYVLKFDKDTTIQRLPKETKPSGEKSASGKAQGNSSKETKPSGEKSASDKAQGSSSKETKPSGEKSAIDKAQGSSSKETSAQETQIVSQNESQTTEEEEIVCRGKESCKEYIKSFLAAVPLRELQADIKKGLMASTPLHHRLQIEFHYTNLLQPVVEFSANKEATANAPAMEIALAVT